MPPVSRLFFQGRKVQLVSNPSITSDSGNAPVRNEIRLQYIDSSRLLQNGVEVRERERNNKDGGVERIGKQSYFLTSKTLYFLFSRESLEGKPRGKLSILFPSCDSTRPA